MAFEVNITPEDIDSLVKDSILKAGLGNAIQTIINDTLKINNYSSPVKDKITNYVSEVCNEIIREKYAAQIREAVSKHIEESVTTEIINKTVSHAVQKMVRAASDNY